MHLLTSRLINIAIALTVVFALVQLFYYFRFKRQDTVTDFDRNLWKVRLLTGFFAAVLFCALAFVPSTGFYPDIDLSPTAHETAFKTLVTNQEHMGEQLDQMREVLYVLLMMSTMYLLAVGAFIGRIWRDRQKRVSVEDPAVKKPLGLEL